MFKLNFHSIKMVVDKKNGGFYCVFYSWVDGQWKWELLGLCSPLQWDEPSNSLRVTKGCKPNQTQSFLLPLLFVCSVLCLSPAQGAGRALPALGDLGSQTWSGPCSHCTVAVSVQIFSFLLRLCQYFFQKPPEGVISSQKYPPILGELSRQWI